jgi:hypothetical protein
MRACTNWYVAWPMSPEKPELNITFFKTFDKRIIIIKCVIIVRKEKVDKNLLV